MFHLLGGQILPHVRAVRLPLRRLLRQRAPARPEPAEVVELEGRLTSKSLQAPRKAMFEKVLFRSLVAVAVVTACTSLADADTLGTEGNQFTLDFVPISGSTNPTPVLRDSILTHLSPQC